MMQKLFGRRQVMAGLAGMGLALIVMAGLVGPAPVVHADCGPVTAGDDNTLCDDDPDGVLNPAGADAITVQDGATLTGPIVTGDGGDTITNNGTIAVALDNGLGVWAVGDGSTVTNNGAITTSGTDAEGIYVQGSSTVVNNGTITTAGASDSEGVAAYDGNNTVVNTGTITTTDPDATGIDTGGGPGSAASFSGDDTVINSGDILTNGGAVGIATGEGNDTVVIQGGTITGLIDGGADTDALQFDVTVGAEFYEAVAAQIAAANPTGGSLLINGQTYTWANFEELVSLLQMAMIADGRLNAFDFAATAIVFCEAGGVHVYTAGGEFAFRVDGAALAGVGSGAVLGDALGVRLTLQADGSLLAAGPAGYTFAFSPAVCGIG
jgi:hypothetical protein